VQSLSREENFLVEADDNKPRLVRRRALLRAALGAGTVAAAFTPRAEAESSDDIRLRQWMTIPGLGTGSALYGMPSRFESAVTRTLTEHTPTDLCAWSLTPLDRLMGIITPNGLVFERHHAGIPEIDPGQHRLAIHGLVERPLVLTMDDILPLPAVSRIHFIECAVNGSAADSVTDAARTQAPPSSSTCLSLRASSTLRNGLEIRLTPLSSTPW
jgi:sulfane dehydrogenase subunit SoxC